jgi:hypothetical protein
MKNLILLIALLITGGLQAQTPQVITTTSASTPAGCATIDVSDNKGAVGFYVGGTWTGTLQPEVQVLNQAPGNSYVVPSTSSTTQTTITANGTYFFPSIAVVGASTALLCGPTTTGTANIYMLTSFASSTVPGSGGGGGLVSSVFGRTGAVTAQTGDYTCAQVTNCGVGSNVKASVDCTQATCPGTDTTLFTTGSGASGSGQAGLYEIAFYAVTTASSPSCTAIDLNLTYTDESSLQSDISSFEWSATAVDSSTLTTSTPVSPQYFWSVPSSAIRYSITPIGICSAVTYSAHLSLLQIR